MFFNNVKSLFYKLPTEFSYSYLKSVPEFMYERILKQLFLNNCGYKLNLVNPKTFNEKIQYLKLYDKNPLKTILSDKIKVREYIKDIISEKHIKKLYGVYSSFDEIAIDILPDSFYLKTNHGCKMQKFIDSKESFLLNKDELKEQFSKWLNINYAFISGFELQYKDIQPKIFAEEVITHPECMLPIDVEIYCFNGVPKLTAVRKIIKDKVSGISLYSTEEGLLPYSINNNLYNNIPVVSLPKYYENMLEIAKKLSKDFIFVRIDFLHTGRNFYFGEMTFSPFSGFCQMSDKELDRKMSKWLVI